MPSYLLPFIGQLDLLRLLLLDIDLALLVMGIDLKEAMAIKLEGILTLL